MGAPKIVRVGLATCGIAAGADKVFQALAQELTGQQDVWLKQTGCLGMCHNEPLVEVLTPAGASYLYTKVTPEKATDIARRHVLGGEPVRDWLFDDGHYLAKQKRVVLRNSGRIDPESIDDYLEAGGYQAIAKALREMTPEQVIGELEKSGLRGRGGAGFPTYLKWRLTRQSPGRPKYIICNADEGDPGAFMDRSVLESDPHSVLEGMLIAAYAIGAREGYIYVRAEYPLAVKRLKLALAAARERGFLGENILGSGFDFDLKLREGAGAFVCGEETALMMSIEGKRGMPRFRPPFPAESGLWGKPTSINNVETYANVPWIILNGGEAFAQYGTERSKGTKVFALAGTITRGGLIEVPMGITIREIVFEIGGGIRSGREFKAVQIGGPSGGCLPASLADTPVDYESLTQAGAIMGSGGLLVMDDSACMVDVAKFFLDFTVKESCGKCTFCRLGTKQMQAILQRITNGEGREGDLELLEELANSISRASLCGLGQTAPNPVLTTLRFFRDEYEAHLYEKRCPAKKCRALIRYQVNPDRCNGCGLCNSYCPTNAISGEKKRPFSIDQNLCTHCGLCFNVCRHEAISVN
ncbi:MAG: NADH-quinone oxidoreductase subunit NuoF [Clostridia bacterium]|nr:NADH-quinone oxidoreductase subunit NuoF [Clostridia bacterium]